MASRPIVFADTNVRPAPRSRRSPRSCGGARRSLHPDRHVQPASLPSGRAGTRGDDDPGDASRCAAAVAHHGRTAFGPDRARRDAARVQEPATHRRAVPSAPLEERTAKDRGTPRPDRECVGACVCAGCHDGESGRVLVQCSIAQDRNGDRGTAVTGFARLHGDAALEMTEPASTSPRRVLSS